MTRRTALKLAGLGASGIAAVGLGAGAVRAGTNGVFNAGDGAPYELWHTWSGLTGLDRVVAAGLLTCNPHNTQPWRITVRDGAIDVFSDQDRQMPCNDASGREHYAGIGCAVESMVVAAGAGGYAPMVELFPEPSDEHLVARIGLTAGARPADEELEAAIPRRHTNRGPYSTRPVSGATMTALQQQVDGFEGAGVRWITDLAERGELGRLYVEATRAILGDREQSVEAFSWFRSSRAAIEDHRDGLTLDCQGLDGKTLLAAKLLPAQSRSDGDDYWVTTTRDVHTATAAAYGVITVDDVSDRAAQVIGGRLLARLHLAATDRKLALHHMNQITERIDRDRSLSQPDVFSDNWSALLGLPASQGLVSFRIGYAQRDAGLSPRRAVSEVVIDER